MTFDHGRVVSASAAAMAGPHRSVGGVKACCRLGRTHQGTVRVRPAEDTTRFHAGGSALSQSRSRLGVEVGPAFFATSFTPDQ